MTQLYSIYPIHPAYMNNTRYDYNYFGHIPESLLRSYDNDPMIIWGGVEVVIRTINRIEEDGVGRSVMVLFCGEEWRVKKIRAKYYKYLGGGRP